jgi:rhamnosyltransferase
MFADKMHVKRLGIYFFYDKDGIVDDYNLFLLNDLKENIDKLLIVYNSLLTNVGRTIFSHSSLLAGK